MRKGLFAARIVEFPGCFSDGETIQQAYQNLEAAALSWLQACLAQGLEVPEPKKQVSRIKDWKQVGVVGVDSGLCWLGDPCYILHKKPGEEKPELGKDWHEFVNKTFDNEGRFAQFGELTGVTVASGYGDGIYPVMVRFEDKRVAEVKVVFIDDDVP
jgi:predicted RNase H-like HicB family nuclease